METPLITKVKTLHKALMHMAESIGITDLHPEINNNQKMSEIVHQMNNIYSKIASALGIHNQKHELLIDSNNELKEKLSNMVKEGDMDCHALNQKQIAGEVWSAQVDSYVENFYESPIDGLKHMTYDQKIQLLEKMDDETKQLDTDIERVGKNITNINNTYAELNDSYNKLLKAKQDREQEYKSNQENIEKAKTSCIELEGEIRAIDELNKRFQHEEIVLKDNLQRLKKETRVKEMNKLNRKNEIVKLKKNQEVNEASKNTMKSSKYQWKEEYSRTNCKLDYLRHENDKLEKILSMKKQYESAIQNEKKVSQDLAKELKYFKVNPAKKENFREMMGMNDKVLTQQSILFERAIRNLDFIKQTESGYNGPFDAQKFESLNLQDYVQKQDTAKFGGELNINFEDPGSNFMYRSGDMSPNDFSDIKKTTEHKRNFNEDLGNLSEALAENLDRKSIEEQNPLEKQRLLINNDFKTVDFVQSGTLNVGPLLGPDLSVIKISNQQNEKLANDTSPSKDKYVTFNQSNNTKLFNSDKKFSANKSRAESDSSALNNLNYSPSKNTKEYTDLNTIVRGQDMNIEIIRQLKRQLESKDQIINKQLESGRKASKISEDPEENIFNSSEKDQIQRPEDQDLLGADEKRRFDDLEKDIASIFDNRNILENRRKDVTDSTAKLDKMEYNMREIEATFDGMLNKIEAIESANIH